MSILKVNRIIRVLKFELDNDLNKLFDNENKNKIIVFFKYF